MTSESNYRFKKIANDASLLDFKDHWQQLVETCIDSSFVHEFNWLHSVATILTRNVTLVTAFCESKLIAIFPIDLSCSKVLTIPYCTQTDLVDFIIDPKHCNEALANGFLNYLSSLRPGWKLLKCSPIRTTSGAAQLLGNAKAFKHIDPHLSNYFFNTTSPEKCTRISKKQIKNITRLQRKLEATGAQLQMHETTLAEFIELENLSWKGQVSRSNIESDQKTLGFYRTLCDRYAKTGQLKIVGLFDNQRLISGQLALQKSGRLSILKIAYDPEYEQYSVGSILLGMTIDMAIQDENILECNLVTGPSWAKRWHPESIEVNELIIFRSSICGALGYIKAVLKDALRPIKLQILNLLSSGSKL
ncbi:GNAT family N-acetyltransferase [Reinekea sp. G2M2-21]|uniref:GNAT family N-acetyltransferase n=1 Tax=Reinekea sp. G2M2-21 TaxID=2788942 RepID=UPI0018AB8AB4|nr:GNAT family N-acetyltransferase [Reinekea sp. G2M2-21]